MPAEPVRRVVDALASVLLAPECAACDTPLDSPTAGHVCATCWQAIVLLPPPLCARCGDPLPSWRSDPGACCPMCRAAVENGPGVRPGQSGTRDAADGLERIRAVGTYEGALRALIHAFKYDGRTSLARPLAALMHQASAEVLDGADLLVPVPLHPWRRLRRGFNQAALLARALPVPVVPALARRRLTHVQPGLTAADRRRNVAGAFMIAPWLGRRARRRLRGATVVLIDDVRTTGATLGACAAALRCAEVRTIRALTVARAVLPPPG